MIPKNTPIQQEIEDVLNHLNQRKNLLNEKIEKQISDIEDVKKELLTSKSIIQVKTKLSQILQKDKTGKEKNIINNNIQNSKKNNQDNYGAQKVNNLKINVQYSVQKSISSLDFLILNKFSSEHGNKILLFADILFLFDFKKMLVQFLNDFPNQNSFINMIQEYAQEADKIIQIFSTNDLKNKNYKFIEYIQENIGKLNAFNKENHKKTDTISNQIEMIYNNLEKFDSIQIEKNNELISNILISIKKMSFESGFDNQPIFLNYVIQKLALT